MPRKAGKTKESAIYLVRLSTRKVPSFGGALKASGVRASDVLRAGIRQFIAGKLAVKPEDCQP